MIGADALSRWVDWDDRNSCILFGDGAGAMVLEAAEGDDGAGLLGECFFVLCIPPHGCSFLSAPFFVKLFGGAII